MYKKIIKNEASAKEYVRNLYLKHRNRIRNTIKLFIFDDAWFYLQQHKFYNVQAGPHTPPVRMTTSSSPACPHGPSGRPLGMVEQKLKKSLNRQTIRNFVTCSDSTIHTADPDDDIRFTSLPTLTFWTAIRHGRAKIKTVPKPSDHQEICNVFRFDHNQPPIRTMTSGSPAWPHGPSGRPLGMVEQKLKKSLDRQTIRNFVTCSDSTIHTADPD